MAWNMIAVDAGTSEKVPVENLMDDAKTAVDEMAAFYVDNPEGKRLIIPFDSVEDRDKAANHIRTYCEVREAGRLTASIWHGFTGTKGEGDKAQPVWSSAAEGTQYAKTPALSVKVKPYVKRTKADATADAADSQPQAVS